MNFNKNEIFIEKAKKVHGDKYDYSKVEYVNSKTKVIVTCKLHGDFKQSPNNHLTGYVGCKKCTGIETLTKEKFTLKAQEIHGDKYDYSLLNSISGVDTKISIICPIHGEFMQSPYKHITRQQGCPECGSIQRAKTYTKSLKTFIKEAQIVHNNKYTYESSVYKHTNKNLLITCPIHGDFKQQPANHLQGQGCPSCAKGGFDPNKTAIFYYLKVSKNDEVFYKVGITNRTIKERFRSDMEYIEVLSSKTFLNGHRAYKLEQWLLRRYSDYRVFDKFPLKIGNTELLYKDIRNLHE